MVAGRDPATVEKIIRDFIKRMDNYEKKVNSFRKAVFELKDISKKYKAKVGINGKDLNLNQIDSNLYILSTNITKFKKKLERKDYDRRIMEDLEADFNLILNNCYYFTGKQEVQTIPTSNREEIPIYSPVGRTDIPFPLETSNKKEEQDIIKNIKAVEDIQITELNKIDDIIRNINKIIDTRIINEKVYLGLSDLYFKTQKEIKGVDDVINRSDDLIQRLIVFIENDLKKLQHPFLLNKYFQKFIDAHEEVKNSKGQIVTSFNAISVELRELLDNKNILKMDYATANNKLNGIITHCKITDKYINHAIEVEKYVNDLYLHYLNELNEIEKSIKKAA